MMVLRVSVDMPELPPLLLLPLDKLAVGVETEVEVELLTDPSEAVTTMTVVEVVGVALSVVEEAVSPEEVVWDSGGVEVVSPGARVVWGASLVDEVGCGAASEVVVADVVASDVVVGSAEVCEEVADVVCDVEVGSALVVSLAVVAATVFPLPLASAALLESEPCLWTKAFVSSLPKIAALIRKPSATEVADRAATTTLSTLAERMAMLSMGYWVVRSEDKPRCNARVEDSSRRWRSVKDTDEYEVQIPEKSTAGRCLSPFVLSRDASTGNGGNGLLL